MLFYYLYVNDDTHDEFEKNSIFLKERVMSLLVLLPVSALLLMYGYYDGSIFRTGTWLFHATNVLKVIILYGAVNLFYLLYGGKWKKILA